MSALVQLERFARPRVKRTLARARAGADGIGVASAPAAQNALAPARQRSTLNHECSGISGQGAFLGRRRLQRGSLSFNEPLQRWEGRWREDILQPDGTVSRKRRWAVLGTKAEFPTEKLAQRELDRKLEDVNAVNYQPRRVSTITEYAQRWTAGVLTLQADSSQRAAKSHLNHWIKPQLGRCRLDAITFEQVQSFVLALARCNLSRKTINNVVGVLAVLLRDARLDGYKVPEIPFNKLKRPRKIERPRPHYTPDQVRHILAAASEPWGTFFAVLAMTGLRPGEALGLQWQDLDFIKQVIRVNRSSWYGQTKLPKTTAGERTVPMPAELLHRLQAYRQIWPANPAGFLFATRNGRPPSTNKVQNDRLRPILKALGIYTPGLGLYSFRHFVATQLLDVGASPKSVQAQLGHTDATFTVKQYGHVVPQHQAEAMGRLAANLNHPPEVCGRGQLDVALPGQRIQ